MKGKIQPIQQSMAKKLLFFGGIALLTIFSQAIFRENSFAGYTFQLLSKMREIPLLF